MHRAKAFTLIETAAVLALIGLMASAGALSLRAAYRGSQMSDVLSRIKAIDHAARSLTRLTGRPGTIHIDRAEGSIRFAYDKDSDAGLLPVVLPNGFRISDVQIAAPGSKPGSDKVSCSAKGQTPAYTLSINGPHDQIHRIVFAGLTGQATEYSHDETFEFDKLLTPRVDAD